MKKASALIILLILVASSAAMGNSKILVLEYSDFGPQSMAWEEIGHEWWQWDSHDDSRPRYYAIKIVVYKDIPLAKVKEIYPVIQAKEQDYRYFEYSKAIEYLAKNSIEVVSFLPELSERLSVTRKRIISEIGD